jgi:hypothetical protein
VAGRTRADGAGDGDGRKPAAGSARERKGFPLRLPPRMLAELRGWANQDLRSLNAQIEYLLAEALRRRKGPDRPKEGGG